MGKKGFGFIVYNRLKAGRIVEQCIKLDFQTRQYVDNAPTLFGLCVQGPNFPTKTHKTYSQLKYQTYPSYFIFVYHSLPCNVLLYYKSFLLVLFYSQISNIKSLHF